METTTSFDLKLAIQSWRVSLAQSPKFLNENLDELESHLRDAITGLQTRGLSAEEAFMVAAKRIGRSASLEAEFAKINAPAIWLDRILWMLIGLQTFTFVSAVFGRVVRGAVIFMSGYYSWVDSRIITFSLFAAVQLLVFAGSIFACWWLIVRRGEKFGGWFARYLKRPAHTALICGLLWVLSTAALVLAEIFQTLPMKFFTPNTSSALYGSLGMATSWVHITTAAGLIALTLVLARKRFVVGKV